MPSGKLEIWSQQTFPKYLIETNHEDEDGATIGWTILADPTKPGTNQNIKTSLIKYNIIININFSIII